MLSTDAVLKKKRSSATDSSRLSPKRTNINSIFMWNDNNNVDFNYDILK